MKSRFLPFVASLGILASVISCSNEMNPAEPDNPNGMKPEEFLNITYSGRTYENVPVAYDENGDIVFLDNEFSAVYASELADCPELTTFVESGTDITFYKNLEETLKAQELTLLEGSSLRSTPIGGYGDLGILRLFDDRNFKDRTYTFTLNATRLSDGVPDLKASSYKYNDKCSSLILTNNLPNDAEHTLKLGTFEYPTNRIDLVFIGYDDKNYSDRSIVCIATAGKVNEYSTLPNFNDKLSSFKFLFAQKGQYSATIDPTNQK